MKKIVHYIGEAVVIEGGHAYLTPQDHPNERLNGKVCSTSRVISYDKESGVIETSNSIYKKAV